VNLEPTAQTNSGAAKRKMLSYTDWKDAQLYPGITVCSDFKNPCFNCKGMFENGESKQAINPYILVRDKDDKLYRKSLVGIKLTGGVYDEFPYGSYKVCSVDDDSLTFHYRWQHCNVSVDVDGKSHTVSTIFFKLVDA